MSNLIPLELARSAPSAHPGGRHQIKRSISELASPGKLSRHHYGHRKDRHPEDRASAAANPIPLARGSLDQSRSEGVTPVISPDQSRRASILIPKDDDGRLLLGQPDPRGNKGERLREEQDKSISRVDGLKQSLVDLSAFSTATTRRLDDTYYAVLEKTSSLQNTITALKELAESSREIYGNFETESRDLEHDIVSQLGAVGRFEVQQGRIESLQGRIRDNRKKIGTLSERVDTVRRRVEDWERADEEWQEKTRKRLRVIWASISAVTLAVILLFVGMKTLSSGDPAPELHWNNTPSSVPAPQLNASNTSRYIADPGEIGDEGDGHGECDAAIPWRRPPDDERLRIFDEL